MLVAAIFAVYSQVRSYGFVNLDDPLYVSDNNFVSSGLSARGFAWAFNSAGVDNWFPLTWLSHMADVQLFGMHSGWHHLTNVLLHALATILLFAALKRLTGARWPSAFVAMLFALHPLHVESVAWIAERKDVLSACFWFLTIWCYARYAERPGTGRYLLVLAAFAGGLMSKPMIVTLPFVLLLLDIWPLRRGPRLWEKAPLLGMAAAGSLMTFQIQRHFGAVIALATASVGSRIENALISYVAYIGSMFWPVDLAVLYPYPRTSHPAEALGAVLVLAAISTVVVRQFRSRPYLAVGWCWYLGTLVPVIGLVQVGLQARADRYMYVPMVGLSIMLAWGAAEVIARRPGTKTPLLAAGAAVAVGCLAVTWFQIQYWASSYTLFRHAAEVTSDNYVMHNNLSNIYLGQGRNEDARAEALESLRINPAYLQAHVNLGSALSRMGQTRDAEMEYRRAIELDSSNAEAHVGLGAVLALGGRTPDALQEMREAIRLEPGYADARFNMGKLLAGMGRNEEAISQFAVVIKLQPGNANAHYEMARALAAQGMMEDAASEFSIQAQLRPNDANAQFNIGLALARIGKLDDAIAHFTEALRLNPNFEAARTNMEIAKAQRDGRVKH